MKKKGSEYHQRHPSATAISVSNAAAGNQLSMYSGPPPPYTYPSATANSTSTLASLISASEGRKDSSDEKEQPHRQGLSLPSIQEAILGDQQYPKTSPTSATHPGLSIPPRSHPLPAFSAPDSHHTSPSNTHHPISYPSVAHPSFPASTPQPANFSGSSRESYSHTPAIAPIDTNGQAPVFTATSPLSPRREQSAAQTPTSMHSQSYQSYPSTYSFPQQKATTTTLPPSPYRPSNLETSTSSYAYPSSRFEPPELTRVDETRKHAMNTTHGEVYGNSVRRHLDIFDLEASLNGVSDYPVLIDGILTNVKVMEGSGRLFDIARYHKTRAQETRGPSQAPAPMLTLDECDRMLQHHQSVGHSLTSMREMLLAQEKNVASQQAQDRRYKASADYEMDTSGLYEDTKPGNGIVADNKKRRAVSSTDLIHNHT
jgi:hypothetical protein